MNVAQLLAIAGVEELGPDDETWSMLKLGGKADSPTPRPILENVVLILTHDPRWRGRIWFDGHRGRNKLDRRAINDTDEAKIALWLSQAYGLVVRSTVVGEAMSIVAAEHEEHPLRSYLSSVQWDGVERLDGWLTTYLGVTDDALTRAIGRCWALSAVARVFQPGCKVDTVLILVGGQGAGKSTALRVLGGEWFSDTPITVGSKDTYEQITGTWIYELAELDAFRKAEWPQIKALISSPSDNVRRAYARNAVDVPRQGIFVGTTNREDCLSDVTGSRRFWPVTVGRIDIQALRRDRDQLWAEAVARYEDGAAWWLDASEDALLAERSERYEVSDPWAAKIAIWMDNRLEVEMHELLAGCLERPSAQQSPHDAHRAGAVLSELGYVRQRQRRGKSRASVWVRGDVCTDS
jgi:putative DNA primase/helicase